MNKLIECHTIQYQVETPGHIHAKTPVSRIKRFNFVLDIRQKFFYQNHRHIFFTFDITVMVKYFLYTF